MIKKLKKNYLEYSSLTDNSAFKQLNMDKFQNVVSRFNYLLRLFTKMIAIGCNLTAKYTFINNYLTISRLTLILFTVNFVNKPK
jgi:hypothetical protein